MSEGRLLHHPQSEDFPCHGDWERFLTKNSYLHPVVDVTEDVGCVYFMLMVPYIADIY